MSTFGQTYSQPNTIFIVWKISGITGNSPHVFTGINATNTNQLFWTPSQLGLYAGSGISAYAKTAPFDYILNSIIYNTTNSSIYENGALKNSGLDVGTRGLTGLFIGGAYTLGSDYWFDGDIAEIIYYNSILTANDRQQVET